MDIKKELANMPDVGIQKQEILDILGVDVIYSEWYEGEKKNIVKKTFSRIGMFSHMDK